MNKKEQRLRRAKRLRIKLKELESVRLCIYRSSKHMYAQIFSPTGEKVLASVSTLDKDLKDKFKSTGNVDAAKIVGKLIAQKALDAGVKLVSFDRAGFKYHGRVKALADAAREGGLQF
ncbi:50S ribosomal protein L18 [Gammaproteobacteria bacterium]|nr:50S ribosomal protein L18 [Gammaproteobacteria bacterium]